MPLALKTGIADGALRNLINARAPRYTPARWCLGWRAGEKPLAMRAAHW